MSVRTMSLVFEYNMPDLKTDDGRTVPDSTAKFVLLALADHCNDEGEGAYPSIEKLCKKTSMSKATVCNAINALRHNGFTNYEGYSKLGTKNYTISVAKLSQIPEVQPLKSQKFNGRNPESLAAEMESSINHHINREREKPPALDFKNMTIPQARKVPALKMYADATGWFPADILWEQIHETITKHNLTADKIRAAALAWVGKGYKRGNVIGILEWAVNGVPGEKTTSPAESVEVDKFASLREMIARQEAQK